ncbi:MAG: hypothetical protein WC428_08025 [Candidatus Paceibacterota bacterium]|jgi:hypothetical protein
MKIKVEITKKEIRDNSNIWGYADNYVLRRLKNAQIPVFPWLPIEVNAGRLKSTEKTLTHTTVFIWSKMNHE